MFILSKLKIGQKVSQSFLKELVKDQNFTRVSNGYVGEVILWANGAVVQEYNHLQMCPESTTIECRQEYFGTVWMTKTEGVWYVTGIKVW